MSIRKLKKKGATYKCAICKKRTSCIDIHHKVPRVAKGSDSRNNLLVLCSDCHTAVHTIAHKIKSGKTSEMEDIARTMFPDSIEKRRKLFEYAAIVFKSMQERELTEDDEIVVPVLLSRGEYAKVKTLASNYRNQQGQKLSIQATLRGIINEKLVKEFPNKTEESRVTTKVLVNEASKSIVVDRKRH